MAYIPKQHLQYDVLPSCRANGGEVFLYPCEKECWEVLADPTGMAQRALDGEADTLSSWILELDGNAR